MKKHHGYTFFSAAVGGWGFLVMLILVLTYGCSRQYEAQANQAERLRKSPQSVKELDERPAKGFIGPVRRAIAKRYRQAADGSGKMVLGNSSAIVFDRDGRFVSEDFYDDMGKRTSTITAVRDKSGRTAGEETRSAQGKVETKADFGYDEHGRLVEETYYAPDGKATGIYRYEYTPSGKRAKRTMRAEYSDGSFRNTEATYRYDAEGNLAEEIYIETSLGLALRIEHVYRNGKRIRTADYQRGSWLEFLTFYVYDKNGNRVRETSYQIPDNEYGDSFQSTTSQETMPVSLLSSETIWEYEYYENR